jgi:putative acetyltransferase
MLTAPTIRSIRDADLPWLMQVWERAVRATHHFLTRSDIEQLRPLVAKELQGDAMDLWILVDANDAPLGFIGIANDKIEALFLDPEVHRRGGGRRLVAHVQSLRSGALTVDVNEQNDAARAFYERLGFQIVGRSDLDDAGRPFPLLHMRRPPPSNLQLQERS